MDEFIDLSAFGSSSSRESSPMHLPTTPELNDSSAAFTNDPFYQSFYAASAATSTQVQQGNSVMGGSALENLKDASDSWNSFDRLLSPSLFGSSSFPGESAAAMDGLALFSQQFAPTAAPSASVADVAAAAKGGVFGSPPLTASPSSSPSTSFALEQTESNSSAMSYPTFGHPSFAIDPQLVAAPSPVGILRNGGAGAASVTNTTAATSSASSPVAISPSNHAAASLSALLSRSQPKMRALPPPGSYNEDDDEDDEDDDEDGDGDMKSVSRNGSLPPVGKGGKGSSARRSASGIVQSGGITKQRVTSAVVALDKDPNDTEDWRPTPEEYKKLSSKEKRQLRNKISARNFRVRRKGMYFFS